ncbi:metal-dependent transcriptional regulator [Sinomicrobium oceani]|uniref:metal-dependent transcriptional regulator n=1 Tax=Sinomicrobium oceani TaxID=1150368 RepID=UPI00227B016A|nr:metal-dependent transcriptional regulator [Sinomicrobium oceani]
MNSLTEENYLKAIYSLSADRGTVNVNDLSKRLDIRMPTVTSMMKKLAERKLVRYEKYKPVSLTPKGEKAAMYVVRKHRLTEMFLVEIMGFGWEEVHDIAEQIEHVKSAEFFRKMDELLGHPSFDPHGSPIPDPEGNIRRDPLPTLSECREGEKVSLSAVSDSSSEFLTFLNSRRLSLGTEINILSIEPFDGSMMLSYDGTSGQVFSKVVCDKLLVGRKEK